jgi:hypothetical protein
MVVINFFQLVNVSKVLSCSGKKFGFLSDGAPAPNDKNKGVSAKLKNKVFEGTTSFLSPHFIRQQALCAKSLKMNYVIDIVIRSHVQGLNSQPTFLIPCYKF